MHASSEPVADTPENPNDISIFDAETQSGNEHEPSDNVNDAKVLGKHASMVHTQLEQVAKSPNGLLNEMNNKMNDHDVRVMTMGGKMTQETLYPEGHPKRIEQDSQRTNVDEPQKKKRKMTELCMLLVNLLLKHLRIPMIFLFLMLKHNLVMNMNLVIMLMMMFMLKLNLAMTMM